MRRILTPEDLKKSDLAEPGWYPAEYVDYDEKPAETDGSTNCLFDFKLLDGPSKGARVRRLVNEKSLEHRTIQALWISLGIPKTAQGGYELSTELFKAKIGAKLKIYIKRGKSNQGNEFNDVADYQPLAA